MTNTCSWTHSAATAAGGRGRRTGMAPASDTGPSVRPRRRGRRAAPSHAARRPGAYRLVAAPDRPEGPRHGHRPRPTPDRGPWTGRVGRPTAAAVRRRVLLGTVAAALLVILALPWGGTGGSLLATPGSALAGAPVMRHSTYIVQPGDSLWSIAERLDPGADPRPIVAQLARQVGGDTVVAGERLVLP